MRERETERNLNLLQARTKKAFQFGRNTYICPINRRTVINKTADLSTVFAISSGLKSRYSEFITYFAAENKRKYGKNYCFGKPKRWCGKDNDYD